MTVHKKMYLEKWFLRDYDYPTAYFFSDDFGSFPQT